MFYLLLHELLSFAKIQFSRLFSIHLFRYWLKIYYIWICLDVIQIKFEFCRTWLELFSFANIYFSGLFSAVFSGVNLKFGIWNCLDIIQIKLLKLALWDFVAVGSIRVWKHNYLFSKFMPLSTLFGPVRDMYCTCIAKAILSECLLNVKKEYVQFI